jgi:hypothetical protein
MHQVAYRYPAPVLLILIAFSLSYVVWLRRVVLDIPVALRFLLSVVPAVVLYRAVFSLRMLLFYDARPLYPPASGPHQPWLLGFITVTGIASLVLYQIWRDVNLGDLKWRQESDVVPLLGRDEIGSNNNPSSRRA